MFKCTKCGKDIPGNKVLSHDSECFSNVPPIGFGIMFMLKEDNLTRHMWVNYIDYRNERCFYILQSAAGSLTIRWLWTLPKSHLFPFCYQKSADEVIVEFLRNSPTVSFVGIA